MKRKPMDIVANVIDILNGLGRDSSYSYNEMKTITGMHYDTIRDYITLIGLIQTFAPKIIIDEKRNKVSVENYSPSFRHLDVVGQFLVILFLEHKFTPENAMNPTQYFSRMSEEDKNAIESSPYFEKITRQAETAFYLSRKGKFKAQGLLASLSLKMAEFTGANGKGQILETYNYEMKDQSRWLLIRENQLRHIMETVEDIEKNALRLPN